MQSILHLSGMFSRPCLPKNSLEHPLTSGKPHDTYWSCMDSSEDDSLLNLQMLRLMYIDSGPRLQAGAPIFSVYRRSDCILRYAMIPVRLHALYDCMVWISLGILCINGLAMIWLCLEDLRVPTVPFAVTLFSTVVLVQVCDCLKFTLCSMFKRQIPQVPAFFVQHMLSQQIIETFQSYGTCKGDLGHV